MMRFRHGSALRFGALVGLISLLMACAAGNWRNHDPTTGRSEPSGRNTTPELIAVPDGLVRNAGDLYIGLYSFYQQWEGAPYQLGGTSKHGIDCSAFVQQAFSSVAGINLPRTTHQQMKIGYALEGLPSQAGDLLFFDTGRSRHVGIYLGDNKFMHASTRRGVALSRIDDDYWHSRVIQIRRVGQRLQ